MNPPVRIAVTGAAGNIAYALLFRIAAGDMLGKDQPVILKLLEIPPALGAVHGVVMELMDCAFPLLVDVEATDDPNKAFEDVDYALLVGSKPRTATMQRSDLLKDNGKIFSVQGKALNANASRNVRILVVGNPANTNAFIAASNAPDLDSRQFTAMTRLDHNRAKAQLANKISVHHDDVLQMTIWGNHSATQYPDIFHVRVHDSPVDVPAQWLENTFIPEVQNRGTAIIKARGASSAASAASAAIDHMHDWALGTRDGDWVSMAIPSDGSYGIAEGIMYSFPVQCIGGDYRIVQNLTINDFSRKRMLTTEQELIEEREAVRHLMG